LAGIRLAPGQLARFAQVIPADCRTDWTLAFNSGKFRAALFAASSLLLASAAVADDLVDLRASFARIPPYTQPASPPVTRAFSIPGPGTLRMVTTLSPWYRVGEPVRFRSQIPVDGQDEGAWAGRFPGVERVSTVSTPERWVDGAALTIVNEYRAGVARPSLELGLFPSAVRYGDGSMEQLENSVQVTISWVPDSATTRAGGLAGIWADPDGPITLHVQGNSVSGSYPFKNGRLSGNLSGASFTGHWMQDGSALRQ
jgi:hypothetical protein